MTGCDMVTNNIVALRLPIPVNRGRSLIGRRRIPANDAAQIFVSFVNGSKDRHQSVDHTEGIFDGDFLLAFCLVIDVGTAKAR